MMKLKKILSVLLAAALLLSVFGFAACGDSDSSSGNFSGKSSGKSSEKTPAQSYSMQYTCDWCGKSCSGVPYYAKSYRDTLCEECAANYLKPMGASDHKKDQDTTSGSSWTCADCGATCRGSRYYTSDYSEDICVYCASEYWCPFAVKNYIKD